MSLTHFTPCGYLPAGQVGSLTPLRGWFWPFAGGSQQLDVGYFPYGFNTSATPCSITNRDFFKLYWRLHRLTVDINVTWVAENDPEPPLPGKFAANFRANKWFYQGNKPGFTLSDESNLPTRNIPNRMFGDPDYAEVRFEGRIAPAADPEGSGATFAMFFRNSSAAQGESEAGPCFIIFFLTAGGYITSYRNLFEDYLPTAIEAKFMGKSFVLYAYLQTISSNNNLQGTVQIKLPEPEEEPWYSYDGLYSPQTGQPFIF